MSKLADELETAFLAADPTSWEGSLPFYKVMIGRYPAILSALRRVENLEAALRPFVRAADSWDSKTEPVADADVWTLCNPDGDCIPYDFTVGQFRAARQALTGEA